VKLVCGIWLPDTDDHFKAHLPHGPEFAGGPTYQFDKLQAAFPLIANFRTAIDVGAHCGIWARVLCRMFGNVEAFEPVSDSADCLEKNAPSAIVHRVALGNKTTTAFVDNSTGNSGNAHIAQAGSPVEVHRLDEYELKRVDFVKIDCEGYEQFVIEGGAETFKRNKPVVIVEQHAPWSARYGVEPLGAVKALEALGYRIKQQIGCDYIMARH
jgi:FkbM family methyltransferase